MYIDNMIEEILKPLYFILLIVLPRFLFNVTFAGKNSR